MIQVFIVDDHKMVIEGLELLFREHDHISVIGSATGGEEALEMIPKTSAQVVLLDINMPGLNGMETCKQLLVKNPELKIIALSMHKESSLIKMMLSRGAKGYVLKNAGQEELIQAVETVHQGKMYLDKAVNDIVVKSIASGGGQKKTSPFPSISRREKEVLKLILEEYTTQEIAEKLFISFGTVETHRRNMMSKLGAKNTAGLVRIALEYQLDQ
ncbi:response regulator transcription factor [Flavobacteriaceae bacterium TP-CH-4]|uniref:Response regulator transcription factor n=1 Tax=Pelagihabitans pacificus TaxID=2696054 RepID=A0A967AX18_9FLAO|nr:response regulator transcription factor [Pelagihabitans pacificus]NHF59157.1 response regulator transcription factor [Pelagihabitans pacificus]